LAKNVNDLIIPAIQGLADEDLLVITVPVADGELDSIPSNVRAEKFIPFDQILPHVDVMITNGGYGGTQMALAHGIPLVLAGSTDDKKEVSARVEWAGAGINLRKLRPSSKEIRNAVKAVLSNPQYKNNAKKIQEDFQNYNAPLRVSELLESLVLNKSNSFQKRQAGI
jgi:UDP:flavonoid glycosyltransferase YjiC (YdhE family)